MDYGCSFGGNAFFLAAYSVLIPLQLNYVIRCRTWGFSYDTLGGMIFEALGYASRVIASQDTNARGYFTT